MTPQALKASVLQLAIQGKLVPQRPEEGTAEELYQQIQAEKQQLIANGTIKREKALAPIKEDEIPFDIPKTWKWVRFGSVVINRDSERIPLSVNERSLLDKIYDYYGASGVIDKVDSYLFDKTLLLIGEDGANLLMRSKPIAFIAKGKYWVNNHAHVLEVGSYMTLEYLALFINSISLAPYVTGTAQPKMNQEKMNSIPVAIPPLEEQKRIVAKIEEMLPLIDRYGEAYTKLETFNKRFPDDLRKSILQEAIQGKLVPQLPEEGTAEELYQQILAEKQRLIAAGTIKKEKPLPPIEEKDLPFDIPETWKWVRLGDCFDIATGKTPSKSEPQNYMPAVVPFFKPADILNGERIETCSEYVSEQGAQAAPLFTSGSLLVNCIGNIGRCAIVEREGICNQQINIIMKNECCDMRYILHVMLSDCVRLQEMSLSTETTITLLNKNNFRTILIPLPPLKEQKRIVAKIEELLTLCKILH